MHKSLEKFAAYVEKGLIRQVISPCKKLVLWNYTDHCTYERAWDDVTLNARGTVYEISTGRIVARAFPKFFNYGELSEEKKAEVLNAQEFEAFEKMDGSLGIVYYYDGEWRVNTRGSFTSDQAVKGKEMLDQNYPMLGLNKDFTLMVEIIYPENKIIVDYGNREFLSLLAVNSNFNEKADRDFAKEVSEFIDMNRASASKFDTIEELMSHLATLDHTEEGYVVRLANGYRVKFKSAEYLALARIISNMSPLTFWERMENGVIDRDFLEQLPEEFRDDCDAIADRIEAQFETVGNEVDYDYTYCMGRCEFNPHQEAENRKKLGLFLKDNKIRHSGAMFSCHFSDSKARYKYIKKHIRPTGNIIKE